MLAVKTTELTSNFTNIANRVARGEKVVISCPEQGNIVLIMEKDFEELSRLRKKAALKNFGETMRAMQEQAVENGTTDMSMDEIDEIIAEVRQAKWVDNRA